MVMLTLTYARKDKWAPTQIGAFCKWLSRKYDRAYVWVAELQKRGAMHYHLLTSLPEDERWNKDEIEFEWYWGYVWITDNIRNPMYLLKYLQKGYQKNGNRYPKGARIVGAGGVTRGISDGANRERLCSRYPYWVQRSMDKAEIREMGGSVWRARGGFWIGSGMAISPYSRFDLPDTDAIQQVMSLAYFGRLVYNGGGWELPQS